MPPHSTGQVPLEHIVSLTFNTPTYSGSHAAEARNLNHAIGSTGTYYVANPHSITDEKHHVDELDRIQLITLGRA